MQKDKMVFSILVILVGSDVQKDKMVFSILVILVGSDVQKDKMVFSILVILVVSAAQKDKMVFSIMVILVGPAVQKGKMDFSIKVILVVSDVQKGKMDFSIKVILVVSDMQKGKMDFSIKVILVVSDVQKGKMDFSIKVILVVSDLQKGKMDFSIKVILVALVKCRVSLLKALNLTCLQDFSMSEAHMIKQKEMSGQESEIIKRNDMPCVRLRDLPLSMVQVQLRHNLKHVARVLVPQGVSLYPDPRADLLSRSTFVCGSTFAQGVLEIGVSLENAVLGRSCTKAAKKALRAKN